MGKLHRSGNQLCPFDRSFGTVSGALTSFIGMAAVTRSHWWPRQIVWIVQCLRQHDKTTTWKKEQSNIVGGPIVNPASTQSNSESTHLMNPAVTFLIRHCKYICVGVQRVCTQRQIGKSILEGFGSMFWYRRWRRMSHITSQCFNVSGTCIGLVAFAWFWNGINCGQSRGGSWLARYPPAPSSFKRSIPKPERHFLLASAAVTFCHQAKPCELASKGHGLELCSVNKFNVVCPLRCPQNSWTS